MNEQKPMVTVSCTIPPGGEPESCTITHSLGCPNVLARVNFSYDTLPNEPGSQCKFEGRYKTEGSTVTMQIIGKADDIIVGLPPVK